MTRPPDIPYAHCAFIPKGNARRRPGQKASARQAATGEELNRGNREEGLGNFGNPTGKFGTVERTNENEALVKWDDDSRVIVGRYKLEEVGKWLLNFARNANKRTPGLSAITTKKVNAPRRYVESWNMQCLAVPHHLLIASAS